MRKATILTLLFWCAMPIFADPVADVRCREVAFSRSVETQDLELFKSFIDSDARFVSNAVLRGPEDIAAAWSVFFEDNGPAIKWRPQLVEVIEDGDLALTRGPYRMTVTDAEGNVVERWGTFNSVWRRKSDGSWRVVFDAGSESAEPPDDATKALLLQEDDCD